MLFKSNAFGKDMTKAAVINLVDLAGSEPVNSTAATGDRLKEVFMLILYSNLIVKYYECG